MKYELIGRNKWVYPKRKGYRLACCDCGLVHEMDFRTIEGRIEFRSRRHTRATAGIRRGMAQSKEIK